MSTGLNVLHIEDDFGDAMLLQHALYDAAAMDLNLEVVRTLRDAKAKLAKKSFDLIVADLRLPDSTSPEATVSTLQALESDTPIVVLTGSIGLKLDGLGGGVTVLEKSATFNRRKANAAKELVENLRLAATRKPPSADDGDALML